jgi:adenylate cyclase
MRYSNAVLGCANPWIMESGSEMTDLNMVSRFTVGDVSPEIERTSQYTVDALARHKQEGLELAVRARWVALVVVAILLLFLNPQIEILFTYFLMALIGLNGWVLRRVGRVGHSQSELIFIFIDVVLFTFVLIGPNPLRADVFPTAIVFQFGTFSYIFIMLAYRQWADLVVRHNQP